MSDTMVNGERVHERRFRAAHTIRLIIFFLVIAAIVLFGLVNTDKVTVDWVGAESEAPLWAVIAVSAIAGALIGALLGALGRLRRS